MAEKELNQISALEEKYKASLSGEKIGLLVLCGKLEEELSKLEEEEKQIFMQELGISQPATKRLVNSSYNLMDLITFYTANEKEVKAWLIPRGNKALKAAGTVHSDKEKGLLKLEGKDYLVQDGDVVFFRFYV